VMMTTVTMLLRRPSQSGQANQHQRARQQEAFIF